MICLGESSTKLGRTPPSDRERRVSKGRGVSRRPSGASLGISLVFKPALCWEQGWADPQAT